VAPLARVSLRVDSHRSLAYDSSVPVAHFQVRVAENSPLGGDYFRLTCESDEPNPVADALPGQFVMIRADWGRDLINPRPFSVLEVHDARKFSLLLKVFGRGSARLQEAEVGEVLACTGILGSSFPTADVGQTQLLVAGGVGLPPMLFQAERATMAGQKVELFYGGRSAVDLVLLERLERLGVPCTLATEDGSKGVRGRVTLPFGTRLAEAKAACESVAVLTCGPTPMLRAVRKLGLDAEVPTYVSLEEQMACGIGVCLGCAVPVHGERPYKYCCDSGPVFDAREIRW